MKRVLFYTHDIFNAENPVGYRIQQYFPYLEKEGFVVSLLTSKTALSRLLRAVAGADVVWIQRVLPNPAKMVLIRRFSKKVVYDFDDAVMLGSRSPSRTRAARFSRMMQSADAVFCGNAFLRDQALRYRSESDRTTHLIPTVLDTDAYPVKTHGDSKPFVLGWIGTASTLRYISAVKDALLPADCAPGIRLKIVADRPLDESGPAVVFERWQKALENEALLSFDAGIQPLRDDPWARGKCGLKLLQYMATGLPSVADPVGVAVEMIEHGVSGFLPEDLDGWKAAVSELAGDPLLRARMGRVAREAVETRYSLKVWGPRVARIVAETAER